LFINTLVHGGHVERLVDRLGTTSSHDIILMWAEKKMYLYCK
jgi:hypothetical protein